MPSNLRGLPVKKRSLENEHTVIAKNADAVRAAGHVFENELGARILVRIAGEKGSATLFFAGDISVMSDHDLFPRGEEAVSVTPIYGTNAPAEI